MSIEKKIADLLEESAKIKALEETTEEEIEVVEEEEEVISEEEKEIYEASFQQHANSQIDRNGGKYRKDRRDSSKGKKVVDTQASLSNLPGKGDEYHPLTGEKPNPKGWTKEKSIKRKSELVAMAGVNKPKYSNESIEDIDVQEDVDALLFGEDLTEEFKVKAATIFEAAVMSRVNAEVATLEEAFEARLVEEAELAKEGIIEKVDGYLDYVVEQWMSDNEVAIENGLKNDIFEGFIQGMKGLFEEHYIEVPEERFDVVGDLQEQVNFLESKLDETLETNVEMAKQLNEMARDSITDEFCSDMTDTEVEKFTALAEELSYEGIDSYTSKLQIIKENYFGKKPAGFVDSVVTDSPVQLTEETNVNIDANVARYLETFNRIK